MIPHAVDGKAALVDAAGHDAAVDDGYDADRTAAVRDGHEAGGDAAVRLVRILYADAVCRSIRLRPNGVDIAAEIQHCAAAPPTHQCRHLVCNVALGDAAEVNLHSSGQRNRVVLAQRELLVVHQRQGGDSLLIGRHAVRAAGEVPLRGQGRNRDGERAAGQAVELLRFAEDVPRFRINGHGLPMSVVDAADVAALHRFGEHVLIALASRPDVLHQGIVRAIERDGHNCVEVETHTRCFFCRVNRGGRGGGCRRGFAACLLRTASAQQQRQRHQPRKHRCFFHSFTTNSTLTRLGRQIMNC